MNSISNRSLQEEVRRVGGGLLELVKISAMSQRGEGLKSCYLDRVSHPLYRVVRAHTPSVVCLIRTLRCPASINIECCIYNGAYEVLESHLALS